MYQYETHLHTAPVSRCAKASAREHLEFYKSLGYRGIFITNHFLDGNINIDSAVSYPERIDFFFSDYEQAVEIGKELDIQVFCGVELSYEGTDFLIYGLDKVWFLNHPEIMEMHKSAELAFMMESGALIIQAHPFREAGYIDHIRLFPRHVHGVEIINSNRKDDVNHIAKIYAEHYSLLPFAGTDNHSGPQQKKLAGLQFSEPIRDIPDFIHKVKTGNAEIFTLNLE